MSLTNRFDGFLIDIDGVMWRGSEPIPGSAQTVTELATLGKPAVFLTNNPRAGAARQAQRLSEIGVPATAERVVTAARATVEVAATAAGERREAAALPGPAVALVVGNESLRELVRQAGMQLTPIPALPGEYESFAGATRGGAIEGPESSRGAYDRTAADAPRARADVVIVSGHTGFDFAELKAANDAIRDGALFYATGRDPTGPMPDGLWPGTGAIVAAVETAAGRRAISCGKPEPGIFHAALAHLRRGADGQPPLPPQARVAMVGDRLDSDIAGAKAAGLATILTLSGATSREELEPSPIRPDFVIETLAGLLG